MRERRTILLVVLSLSASLTACSSGPEPRPVPTGDGDLRYLIGADPAAVTTGALLERALEVEERISQFHVVDGIYWQSVRKDQTSVDPDSYGSGGDSLLFTGLHLANRTYKYLATGRSSDLRLVADAVRGLYILTHISGKPGVLARCAFPKSRADEWGYPDNWGGRIAQGFVYESSDQIVDPVRDDETFPAMIYYTRVTRDQVSGLFHGLSVMWALLNETSASSPEDMSTIVRLRGVVATIVDDVWWQLRNNDFKIVDHTGRNDTGADTIDDDLLRLQILSLYRRTVSLSSPSRSERVEELYQSAFSPLRFPGFWVGDLFNRFSNGDQYYAWNLRFMRAFAVWLLADPDDKSLVVDYIESFLFKHVRNHKNAFFSMIYAVVAGDADASLDASMSLRSWSLRPIRGWCSPVALGWNPGDSQPGFVMQALEYVIRVIGLADGSVLWPHLKEPTQYFVWQKDPWDNGVTWPNAPFDGATLDFSVVYWMGVYYGVLNN